MPESFTRKHKTMYEASFEAQKIAFAPVLFQAVIVLRKLGVLERLNEAGPFGTTLEELTEKTNVSLYGLRVLLEAALSGDVVHLDEKRYRLSKVGHVLLKDEMTRINMDFVNDVCYQGLFHLDDAISDAKPAGLKVFGDWPTVYEGLASLPAKAQKSWFDFDHFYSDSAFPEVLPLVFAKGPRTLLDIGGNTGRWALKCMAHDDQVEVTIADLPGQLNKALANAEAAGFGDRIHGHEINLLDFQQKLPSGFDALWMSQFLCCFSLDEVVQILERAADAMGEDSTLYILDTCWDRQPNDAGAYCLMQTSLYFTCIANGNSQMYHSDDFYACVEKAGLEIAEDTDDIGLSHTLFRVVKPSS